MTILRVLATILAGPLLIVGVIWILQGMNVLPGSFMTGHIQWAGFGGIAVVAGVLLTMWVNRRRN